ncbi:hypothetical protein Lal_00031814 [Lupinus albus]|nr:hypothetical protein Lal_00031814 [Lupinus albus]
MNSCQESEQYESILILTILPRMIQFIMHMLNEMREELEKLAKKHLDKKRLILEHEKKFFELQSFIDELKLENETLDLIYFNSSCNCTTKLSETSTCENSKVLNAENSILKNKFEKFTYSSHNLDNLLAASRNVVLGVSLERENCRLGERGSPGRVKSWAILKDSCLSENCLA